VADTPSIIDWAQEQSVASNLMATMPFSVRSTSVNQHFRRRKAKKA